MHVAVGTNYKQQDTKRPTTQLPLLRFPSKCSVLGMIPAHGATKGMGRPPGHYSPQSPGPAPTLIHLKNQLAATRAATPYPHGRSKGTCYFSLSCCSRSPNTALPKFLIWPHQFLLIRVQGPRLVATILRRASRKWKCQTRPPFLLMPPSSLL